MRIDNKNHLMHLLKMITEIFVSSIPFPLVYSSLLLFFLFLFFIWTHVSVLICTFFFSCVAVLLGKSGNTGEKRPLKLYTYITPLSTRLLKLAPPFLHSLLYLFYLLPFTKCFRIFQGRKRFEKHKQNIITKSKIVTRYVNTRL